MGSGLRSCDSTLATLFHDPVDERDTDHPQLLLAPFVPSAPDVSAVLNSRQLTSPARILQHSLSSLVEGPYRSCDHFCICNQSITSQLESQPNNRKIGGLTPVWFLNSYLCAVSFATSIIKTLGYLGSGSGGSIPYSPVHGTKRTK